MFVTLNKKSFKCKYFLQLQIDHRKNKELERYLLISIRKIKSGNDLLQKLCAVADLNKFVMYLYFELFYIKLLTSFKIIKIKKSFSSFFKF